MKHKKRAVAASSLLAMAVCGCLVVGNYGKKEVVKRTVYREWFDHYQETTPCFLPGTTIAETGCSDSKGLVFEPQEDGALARRGFFTIETPPEGEKWTFGFVYRHENGAVNPFTLRLLFGDRGDPSSVDFTVDRGHKYLTKGFVTVENRRAKLWLYRDGVQALADEATLPAKPLVGWNLVGDRGLKVIVTGVLVRDGVAQAYYPGDPAEWIAALPPVVDEQIPADFGTFLANDKKMVRELDLEHNDACFKFKPSEKARASARVFKLADGKTRPVTFQWENETLVRGKDVLTNETLRVCDREFYYPVLYSRPRLTGRYLDAEKAEIRANYAKMPRPADRVWDVELRRQPGGYGVYVDGVFATSFTNGPVVGVSAQLAPGAAFAVTERPVKRAANVEPLDFRRWPGGFPLWWVRENMGGSWLGTVGYGSRSAFEAMPSSCFFELPVRQWTKVKARCRVSEECPADYEPVVVARLGATHKHSSNYGRTPLRIETTAILPRPGEKPVAQPGVSFRDLGKGEWEVTMNLDIGQVQDLFMGRDPLANGRPFQCIDFELTGVLWRQCNVYVDRSIVPDREARSSVVVLGAEMVAAPCGMVVTAKHPFSTYYASETPASTVTVDNTTRAPAKVQVKVTDEDGRTVETRELSFGPGKGAQEIAFKGRAVGWYGVEYRCGEIVHKASYAVVPDDTRTAGYESPFNAWTWFGCHGTCLDVEQNYDLCNRHGIKAIGLWTSWTKRRNEDDPLVKKYGLRQMQFGFRPVQLKPGQTEAEAIDEKVKEFKDLAARYPHTKRALIFHESGGGAYPWELVGGQTKPTAEQWAAASNLVQTAVRTAKAWRKAAPDVKLVWGNTVDSLPLLANVYRLKVPRDLIDFTGEETVGCMTPPEYSTARAPWMQKKLAKVMGYGDIPVDCPFEWKSRVVRNFWDPDRQMPDYYMRDGLIALALGYSMVPLPVGPDVSNGYVDSVWGSGDSHIRYPLAYPRRTSPAVATMTDIMDRAKLVSLLPTGSLTVYAPEFAVKGGASYATAVWCARGETKVKLDLGENADYELVTLTGHRTKGAKELEIPATESPRYVLTAKPLKGVRVSAKRAFPYEKIPAGLRTAVAVPLASAGEAQLVAGLDPRLEVTEDGHEPRQAGRFALSAVKDEEKGDCIEVKDVTGPTAELMMNVGFVKFPGAKPVAGEYDTIGVWVNGNSSWGRIFFEVTDAEGEVWMSTGPGGYGACEYDWPCQASISFDGWHLVKFPLRRGSHVQVRSVSMNEFQWTRDGEKGNGRIDFPVKVTGLGFGNYQWALDFLDMKPTRPTLRFKDITLIGGK